jgi:predicted nucleic acid-binding protein
MQPVLYDASVYIASLRQGITQILQIRNLVHGSPLWLSAVTLEELYAGAAAAERKRLAKLERDFHKANRLLTPNLTDWTKTGQLLARLGAKYGYEQIGRSRITNDALLAVSAARLGIVVLTINARDFVRIAEFCPLRWELW